MKITIVAGARPNFMKIAPIISEIERQQKFMSSSLILKLEFTQEILITDSGKLNKRGTNT
jgi:UDP-N-acetylglucosamine 2-epimerase